MDHSHTDTRKIGDSKLLHAVVFAVAMTSISLHGSIARAAHVIAHDIHQAVAVEMFEHSIKLTAAFKKRPPRRMRNGRLEQAKSAIGTVTHPTGETQ